MEADDRIWWPLNGAAKRRRVLLIKRSTIPLLRAENAQLMIFNDIWETLRFCFCFNAHFEKSAMKIPITIIFFHNIQYNTFILRHESVESALNLPLHVCFTFTHQSDWERRAVFFPEIKSIPWKQPGSISVLRLIWIWNQISYCELNKCSSLVTERSLIITYFQAEETWPNVQL